MYSDYEDRVSLNNEEQQPSASREAYSSSHTITEGKLSDLIRDLELPKNKAEL
jgi:hypothetical protein